MLLDQGSRMLTSHNGVWSILIHRLLTHECATGGLTFQVCTIPTIPIDIVEVAYRNQPVLPGDNHMPKVRQGSASKWAKRTSAATQEYKDGIAAPRVDWATATTAAANTHKLATEQALRDGRFAKGVQKAGSGKWAKGAAGKGADRFAGGAMAAEGDYAQKVQPFLDVIANTNLPPRGPKGDPNNIQRVAVLAKALRDKKLSM